MYVNRWGRREVVKSCFRLYLAEDMDVLRRTKDGLATNRVPCGSLDKFRCLDLCACHLIGLLGKAVYSFVTVASRVYR